jgi:hypothetical protein
MSMAKCRWSHSRSGFDCCQPDSPNPEDGLRILAADNTENGISLGTDDGQKAIEPLLADIAWTVTARSPSWRDSKQR